MLVTDNRETYPNENDREPWQRVALQQLDLLDNIEAAATIISHGLRTVSKHRRDRLSVTTCVFNGTRWTHRAS